jgi:hypothetical protein
MAGAPSPQENSMGSGNGYASDNLFDLQAELAGAAPVEIRQALPPRRNGTVTEPPSAAGSAGIDLQLRVTDPETVAELRRFADGPERVRFALAALRLGVLSLRMAGGSLDAGAVREAGQKLIGDMREQLLARSEEIKQTLARVLTQYFDPKTGLVPQRLQSLVQKDGELERVLQNHLGPEESLLARTLAEKLGEHSPIFRLLSPDQSDGLLGKVREILENALTRQRQTVLTEFSLNEPGSALSRLLERITSTNGELTRNVREQIDGVVKEFSLDQPSSALSRLVAKVDAAQRSIAEQFSADNDGSVLNRIGRLLKDTGEQINRNLTMDDERSALFRLKRELLGVIESLDRKNGEFHAEVRSAVAALHARKQEEGRSTRHGAGFEEKLGEFLAREAARAGDLHQAVGTVPGLIPNRKFGDYVIELGAESAAAGARIVWECKENRQYSARDALCELEQARKNRSAQLGVFVFSRKTAPETQPPFFRQGPDILVVWDAEDPSAGADAFVKAAYSVARALAVRERKESLKKGIVIEELERAVRAIEKQVGWLDDFRSTGERLKRDGSNLSDRAERMKSELLKQVEALDGQIGNLKTEGA